MQGFGVNTYKWVNARGETMLVKYHWIPKQGVKSYTAADAAAIQGNELGSHTKDLYEAIERGDYPEWELQVQMMSDDEHPELSFDPLDDTKVWPEELFPPKPVGKMVLNRNLSNFFAENEQIAFGTASGSLGRTTTSRPASATSSASSGNATTWSPTSSQASASATARFRSGWSGTCCSARTSWAGASARAWASRRTTCATSSHWPPRTSVRRSRRAWPTSARTGRATSAV
jgi:hypothetical protein